MTKLDWEKAAKSAKLHRELEKILREGQRPISGVSESERRLRNRCPICRRIIRDEEKLAAHVYYRHSKRYKVKRQKAHKKNRTSGRASVDTKTMTTVGKALVDAQRRANKMKNSSAKTTILIDNDGTLQLVATLPGLPYAVPSYGQLVHVGGYGLAKCSGFAYSGSGAKKEVSEVQLTLQSS